MLGELRLALICLILALPIIASLFLVLKRFEGCGTWLLSLLLSAAGCYVFTIIANEVYEIHLERELDRYDLDGDGSFSHRELTPRAEQLMDDLTSDTGRTFAPCTGLVIWPIYSAFWHGLIGGFRWAFLSRNEFESTSQET
jgi:hypothetical protein